MTKIHITSDSPKAKTGFSIVGENLALGLKNLGHETTYTGVQTSHVPEYFHDIKIYPLSSNLLEDSQFVTNLIDADPEIVIYINDMYTDISPLAKIPLSLKKSIITYCPVEGSRIPKRMVNDLNDIANNGGKVIAQCQYGYNEMKRCGVNVDRYIYHGFNPDIFKPNKKNTNSKYCYYSTDTARQFTNPNLLYEQACNECKLSIGEQPTCPYYKEETIAFLKFGNLYSSSEIESKKWEETTNLPISKLSKQFEKRFVYLFVGANHNIRKRIERLFNAYSLVIRDNRQLKDKTWLHLHTKPFSPTGLNLIDMANELSLQENISFSYGNQLSNNLSEECMSVIYNSADCLVSATSSEGFCCLPETSIFTLNKGIVPIKDVCKDDAVLTHKGRFKKINQVMEREYNGEVIEIIPEKIKIPLSVTPEHKILAVKTIKCIPKSSQSRDEYNYICRPGLKCYYNKDGKIYKWCRFPDGDEPYTKYKIEWIEAKNLEVGDFVIYPNNHEEDKDIDEIEILDYLKDRELNIAGDFSSGFQATLNFEDNENYLGEPQKKTISMNASYSRKYANIPQKIKVDESLMRLFGYFIAEGNIANNNRQIEFAFNINEKEYIDDVDKIMNNVFGIYCEHKIKEDNSTHTLRYSNRILAELFKELFVTKEWYEKKWKGKKSHIVHIPYNFLNLPCNKLIEIVKGLWRGDGSYNDIREDSNNRWMYSYTTTSETLAWQLFYILIKLDIIPSLRTHNGKYIYKGEERESHIRYELEIHGEDAFKFENIINESNMSKDNKIRDNPSRYVKDNRYIYFPIKEINKLNYNGLVYNMEVEEDNSYTSSMTIHNCLPVIEAMACGIPCISPDCTSMTELIGTDINTSRGYLAKIQANFMIQDGSMRSLVDEKDLAECMKDMYINTELRERFSKNAIKFSEQYTWDKIVKQWNELIKEMSDRK